MNKSKEIRFKGGPIFLNSGGLGPDDYLLKPIEGGRWTRVILRFGRHWRGNEVGREQALAESEADQAAWRKIVPVQQICVGDNAARHRRMKEKGSVVTMNATEFWAKYGGDGSPKKRETIAGVRRQRDEALAALADGKVYAEHATHMWHETAKSLEEQCKQLVEVAADREEVRRQRDELLDALNDAAARLHFLTNWIESSYGGSNQDVELGRSYVREARAVVAQVEEALGDQKEVR